MQLGVTEILRASQEGGALQVNSKRRKLLNDSVVRKNTKHGKLLKAALSSAMCWTDLYPSVDLQTLGKGCGSIQMWIRRQIQLSIWSDCIGSTGTLAGIKPGLTSKHPHNCTGTQLRLGSNPGRDDERRAIWLTSILIWLQQAEQSTLVNPSWKLQEFPMIRNA